MTAEVRTLGETSEGRRMRSEMHPAEGRREGNVRPRRS
ncbi:MAG: hypothetical protein KatS3mg076_2511 [Candidatus Binatia bacterium]|nr:MAG: hypothetical protein KatS3mg076_2511 [Candidatus Binatia bacterium]